MQSILNILKNQNISLIFYGCFLEVIFLSVIFLEKIYPDLLSRKELLYSFFILSSFGFLFLLLKNVKIFESRKTLKIIIFFLIIFSLTLLFSAPIGPGDIYNYIFRAKIFTYYNQNPFLTAPANFPNDGLSQYISPLALSVPSIYGPLWMSLSLPLAKISGHNIFLGITLFKIFAIIFNFSCLFLIYKIVKLLNFKNRNLAILLYAWNPLILFEIINDGHNDIVMIFFILLSICFLLKEKYYFIMPALILAILIKYIAIIILPFIFLFLIKKEKDRIKFIIINSITVLSIIVLSYAPFWHGWQTLKGVLFQGGLINQNHLSLFPFLVSIFSDEALIIKISSYLIFALFYLYLLFFKFPKDNKNLIRSVFFIFTGYVFIASVWLQPWYFVWIIPLAIISGSRYYSFAIFVSVFAVIHQGYNIFFLIKNMMLNFKF